eukprot:983328-Prymnesium_polylepis.1
MALRLPGASSVAQLWERLNAADDMLHDVGGAPRAAGDGWLGRKGVVADEGVDLQMWGLSAAAAQKMSTEQRTLLGLAHEALLDAQLDPFDLPGRAGVF